MSAEPMSARPPSTGVRAVRVDVVALALLAFASIVPLGALFSGHDALVLVAGAVAIATALNVLLRRASLWPTVIIGVVGLAAYLTFVVFEVGWPRPSALVQVWNGTTGSWADILTAPVPADPRPELVAFPVLLAWCGAEIGTLLALRTRWITWPVVAPLGALVIALLFSGDHTAPRFVLVAFVILIVLTVVLVRANAEDRPVVGASAARRSGAALIGVAAIASAGVGLAAPVTSATERADLHDRYRPPFDLSESVSPLSQLRAALEDDDGEPLFTVQFGEIPDDVSVDHVDVATLTTYHGSVWASDARFGLAGRQLPPDPQAPASAVSVAQRYELSTAYRSPFLPSFGRPTTLRAVGLGFDRVTGMLVGSSDPEAGRRYDVTSQVAVVPDDVKEAAPAGADPALAALTAPPPDGWPAELEQLVAARPTTDRPYEDLLALEAEMRGDRYGYSIDSRVGSSRVDLQACKLEYSIVSPK